MSLSASNPDKRPCQCDAPRCEREGCQDRPTPQIEQLRRLLLDIEGSILAYWTDLPQSECERFRVAIREALGGWEPSRG